MNNLDFLNNIIDINELIQFIDQNSISHSIKPKCIITNCDKYAKYGIYKYNPIFCYKHK